MAVSDCYSVCRQHGAVQPTQANFTSECDTKATGHAGLRRVYGDPAVKGLSGLSHHRPESMQDRPQSVLDVYTRVITRFLLVLFSTIKDDNGIKWQKI